jgi:hypothetical protein
MKRFFDFNERKQSAPQGHAEPLAKPLAKSLSIFFCALAKLAAEGKYSLRVDMYLTNAGVFLAA